MHQDWREGRIVGHAIVLLVAEVEESFFPGIRQELGGLVGGGLCNGNRDRRRLVVRRPLDRRGRELDRGQFRRHPPD